MSDKPAPYTNTELFHLAGKNLDPERIVATYADPSNWRTEVIEPGRCVWVWQGPVIVGYELADWALSRS